MCERQVLTVRTTSAKSARALFYPISRPLRSRHIQPSYKYSAVISPVVRNLRDARVWKVCCPVIGDTCTSASECSVVSRSRVELMTKGRRDSRAACRNVQGRRDDARRDGARQNRGDPVGVTVGRAHSISRDNLRAGHAAARSTSYK